MTDERKLISIVFYFIFLLIVLLNGCKSKENYKKEIELKGIIYSRESFIKEVEDGNKETVELFINAGIDINSRGDDGQTALMAASGAGHTKVAKLLIEEGADVNVRDIKGRTALMIASGVGNLDLVELLIKKGADINVIDNDGWTALVIASASKNLAIAELLIKAEQSKK